MEDNTFGYTTYSWFGIRLIDVMVLNIMRK